MPSKNTIKPYLEGGYYHIYNRGVEKRDIFLDLQDYNVFLNYLKQYLLAKDVDLLQLQLASTTLPWPEKDTLLKLLRLNNFYGEIKMLAYCLMPNHFHFFIQQKGAVSIDQFMQSLCTRYTMYFNRKYKRVGSLFQAVYKAVLVEREEQFLHLSRYIHKQAFLQGETLQIGTQPSSYKCYIGVEKCEWIYPQEVLNYFTETNPNLSYQNFVESELVDAAPIQEILLEE